MTQKDRYEQSAMQPTFTNQKAVEDYMQARAAMIEQACEVALQSGGYGVLVLNGPTYCVAKVSAAVPYGEIHERDVRRSL
jgi:hypothetical protein